MDVHVFVSDKLCDIIYARNFRCKVRSNVSPFGRINVGDKWKLGTLYWRQFLAVVDGISILVASFGYWVPTTMLKDRGC